ncbi:MAG: GspE/PulE family protein [Pseudomonadota bacterium]
MIVAGPSVVAIPKSPAIRAPLTSRAELRVALALPLRVHREPLGTLLANAGSVNNTGVSRALALQEANPDERLGDLMLSSGEIGEDDLYRALADQMGVLYVRLGDFDVDPAALAALAREHARTHRLLPLMFERGRLIVAIDDPSDSEALNALKFSTQHPVEAVLASPEDLDVAIATHYPAIGTETLDLEVDRARAATPAIERMALDKPIVRLLNNLLIDAVRRRASDVHLRAREHKAEVLYRIDGSLVAVGEFKRTVLSAVVARIKVLAGMNVAEHRVPLDGAIHFKTARGAVDMRVSSIPTIHGENVVIRILDPSSGLRRLADVGFSAADEKRMRSLIDRNQGLVLVTGPTGSGKTTTLYAALQELNNGEFHIVTVEDPVEYRLDGVVQIQVQPGIDFTFGKALRHILRHDPDIILLGEIRDAETAKIAVESALTGHLVLSTLHTNSAAQAVTRLIEIGIPPYLVNATLAGVLAQRLVRRNCERCKTTEIVSAEVRKTLGVSPSEQFHCGKGCDECSGTGYRGRIAVYELLELSPAIRLLVRAGEPHERIEAQAAAEGMVRLTAQALELARTGAISLTEVFRARLE